MTFVILFQDDPAADPGIRQAHMPNHLAFLERHAGRISAAGPLYDPGGAGAGGLWIVHTGTAAEAERLVRADPFWPTGLRLSHKVLEWRQVFADGARRALPGLG